MGRHATKKGLSTWNLEASKLLRRQKEEVARQHLNPTLESHILSTDYTECTVCI